MGNQVKLYETIFASAAVTTNNKNILIMSLITLLDISIPLLLLQF